jgi:hypothetical protein
MMSISVVMMAMNNKNLRQLCAMFKVSINAATGIELKATA